LCEVLKLWQGLGYYSRARNLHFTARYIVDVLHGEFPDSYQQLLKLKGVGDYTASAIASICFDEPQAVVDGNVYRVLSRYYAMDTPINSTPGIKLFKNLAQDLLPKDNFGEYNQAIMEFGARQCKPKLPNCQVCPLNNGCLALELNKVADLPVKINKTKVSKKHFNFLVLLSNDQKTLLHKRTTKGIWQNMYQFPLIETKQELLTENFTDIPYVKSFLNGVEYSFDLYNDRAIVHKLSHQHLYTKFWILKVEELPREGIKISDIESFPVPALIGKFINEFNF